MSESESSSDDEGSNFTSSQDDHQIFAGFSAWFSESVESGWIEDWRSYGGEVTDVETAQFLFSENCESPDTLRIYESDQFRKQHVGVIHALFIEECIKKKSLDAVPIGLYYLPPKEVQELLGKNCCFKWQVEEMKTEPKEVHRQCHTSPEPRQGRPEWYKIPKPKEVCHELHTNTEQTEVHHELHTRPKPKEVPHELHTSPEQTEVYQLHARPKPKEVRNDLHTSLEQTEIHQLHTRPKPKEVRHEWYTSPEQTEVHQLHTRPKPKKVRHEWYTSPEQTEVHQLHTRPKPKEVRHEWYKIPDPKEVYCALQTSLEQTEVHHELHTRPKPKEVRHEWYKIPDPKEVYRALQMRPEQTEVHHELHTRPKPKEIRLSPEPKKVRHQWYKVPDPKEVYRAFHTSPEPKEVRHQWYKMPESKEVPPGVMDGGGDADSKQTSRDLSQAAETCRLRRIQRESRQGHVDMKTLPEQDQENNLSEPETFSSSGDQTLSSCSRRVPSSFRR